MESSMAQALLQATQLAADTMAAKLEADRADRYAKEAEREHSLSSNMVSKFLKKPGAINGSRRGKESLETQLAGMENYLTQALIPKSGWKGMASTFLEEPASTWYLQETMVLEDEEEISPQDPRVGWEDFKAGLITRFLQPDDDERLWNLFTTLKQTQGIDAYISTFINLRARIRMNPRLDNLTDKQERHLFLRGLKFNTKKELDLEILRNPSIRTAAIFQHAAIVDKALNPFRPAVNNIHEKNPRSGERVTKGPLTPAEKERRKAQGLCGYCGEKHKEARELKQGETQLTHCPQVKKKEMRKNRVNNIDVEPKTSEEKEDVETDDAQHLNI